MDSGNDFNKEYPNLISKQNQEAFPDIEAKIVAKIDEFEFRTEAIRDSLLRTLQEDLFASDCLRKMILNKTAPAAVPADPGPRKKRTNITPNLIKKIAEYAGRNRGTTYTDLAKRFNLSLGTFKKGTNLRLAVDFAQAGDLGRHATKPDKPFKDDD